MNFITGKARLAAVLGWPVAHSRSPLLHNFWLQKYHLDGAYIPLAVHPENLELVLKGMVASGFAGCNITIPHKESVCSLCNELDPIVMQTRSVNTLVFRKDGSIYGTSTDGEGFIASLKAEQVDLYKGPALVLGAGGAARSIIASLIRQNIPVFVTNRTEKRAELLVEELGAGKFIPWEEWPIQLKNMNLLINATSLGMEGKNSIRFDLSHALSDLVVADVVYTPRDTPLLIEARQMGLKTVEGIGMLLHQARYGFQQWFGVNPVVDEEVINLVMASF